MVDLEVILNTKKIGGIYKYLLLTLDRKMKLQITYLWY
nr:MAG TPA: hypothetical protein [Caudoviricetes sp.]